MHKKLSRLSDQQKERLIQKIHSKMGIGVLDEHQGDMCLDTKKPFGYSIPISNFAKAKSVNYELSPPGPLQVQIEAKAISLNFRDLMIGLGLYPPIEGIPNAMGGDYSGVVVACGEGVDNLKVGDEVISLYGGDPEVDLHFGNRINAFTYQTTLKPENLSFQEACCIPTVFLTAYYGLHHLGSMQKAEKVLIHTASGGVGLAAIQVAKWLGAEIFGTAGTEEKRAFLHSLGIEHVMSSRSMEFYEQMLEYTKGEGVDVVLNTLPGEAVEKGMQLLRNFGRFIQLDKTDIYQDRPMQLGLFKKSTAFKFLDLSMFHLERRLRSIFDEVRELFNQEVFQPLPFKEFAHADLGDALNYMSLSKHVGKIVLNFEEGTVV